MRGHRIHARDACPHPAERIGTDGVCTACGTPDAKPVGTPGPATQVCRRFATGDHVQRCDCPPDCDCPLLDAKPVDPYGCRCADHESCVLCWPKRVPDAKPVSSDGRPCGCLSSSATCGACWPDAKPVDSVGVEDAEPDAKPVDPAEGLGEFIQRALGIAIDQPIDPPPTISETIKRAAERVSAMPYQPWTPPVVSPRDVAAIYGQAPVDVSWEKGPEPIVRPVPQDPGPGPFPRIEEIAHIVPVSGLFELNSFVFRAEVPPAPGSAQAAELARQAAERKAKARRTGARRVARAARQRARGIRPCDCDCNRSDW